MDVPYIIIQAGGKGSRLGYLTNNKPKALVPVNNLPMIFHIFRKYPDKRFIIIGDYKKSVLREYLRCFADVRYRMAEAGGSGTCGGLRQALGLIPGGVAFMLMWSDLILPEGFEIPGELANYIGISQSFRCRWSYQDERFREEPSEEHGVGGLFIFQNKSVIADVPESGEFVAWLGGKEITFSELGLDGAKEYGLLSILQDMEPEKCRPFNRIYREGGIFVKEVVDKQGLALAGRECNWYRYAREKGYSRIPKIFEYEPIKMEFINGRNIYEYRDITTDQKKKIIGQLVMSLKELHCIETIQADNYSIHEAYIGKTFKRLDSVRDLIPFADREYVNVNGRDCRNIFFRKQELEAKIESMTFDSFHLIHGDPTFSNIILRDGSEPVLIDPRGYFGFTELHGDPLYDWAKLYYSIVGNYDRFNLKDFELQINDNGVLLEIASSGWEDLENYFLELTGASPEVIKLIHAIIWLSLTTYAWQDYDSVCGAFYNGLRYLSEAL